MLLSRSELHSVFVRTLQWRRAGFLYPSISHSRVDISHKKSVTIDVPKLGAFGGLVFDRFELKMAQERLYLSRVISHQIQVEFKLLRPK